MNFITLILLKIELLALNLRFFRRQLLKICIPVINIAREKQLLSTQMNLTNLSYVRNLSDTFLTTHKTLDHSCDCKETKM